MKKIRFFFGFLTLQENWLNKLAKQGWRLSTVQGLIYTFEQCHPNEYVYCVDCAINKTPTDYADYIIFLRELGYNVFQTRLNLNFSIGKIRWRLGGSKLGHIDHSFNKFNKEILILEKQNDNKPFELYSTVEDKKAYLKELRNAYIPSSAIFLFFFVFQLITSYASNNLFSYKAVVFFILFAVLLVPIIIYQTKINQLRH